MSMNAINLVRGFDFNSNSNENSNSILFRERDPFQSFHCDASMNTGCVMNTRFIFQFALSTALPIRRRYTPWTKDRLFVRFGIVFWIYIAHTHAYMRQKHNFKIIISQNGKKNLINKKLYGTDWFGYVMHVLHAQANDPTCWILPA